MSESLNAASPGKLKEQQIKDKRRLEQQVSDVRFLMSNIEGRRFLWRLLGHCKVFESIWDNSARIHHNSGKQDVGHFVMAEIVKADPKGFSQMMSEADKGDL